MYSLRSLLAFVLVFSFCLYAEARVAHHHELALSDKESKHQGILQRWSWNNLFGKRQEPEVFTEIDCPAPDYLVRIMDSKQSTDVQSLCNTLLNMPPATSVVEYTPIDTITTTGIRTAASTQTVRTVTTETVTQMTTSTPAAMVPRAENMDARIALVHDVISSILANGTTSSVSSTPGDGRDVVASELAAICSCKPVAPLSTVISTFTAPSRQTTVERLKLRLLTETETKIYTTTTTVIQSLNQTSNPSTAALEAQTVLSGRVGQPSGLSSAPTNATLAPLSITSLGMPSTSSIPSVPVVIGIPFQCPKANDVNPRFIVGDLGFEYSILCDRAVVDGAILPIQHVANETACAAECSLLNNATQKPLCQAAVFVPTAGSSDGQCFIHETANGLIQRPGSVTILLKSVFLKSDNCKNVDLANGPNNGTVDTAQIVSSVVSAGFSMSTPGLISQFATGGVSESYFSTGQTGSDGIYRWSKFNKWESSSVWEVEFRTSWNCTAPLTPRTVTVQQPAQNDTSVLVDVTTIFNANGTIVISGRHAITRVSGEAGEVTPVPVVASETGGSAAFTNGSFVVTSTATAGQGLVSSYPTSGPTDIPSLRRPANETVFASTGLVGSASFTASGSTAVTSISQDSGAAPQNGTIRSFETTNTSAPTLSSAPPVPSFPIGHGGYGPPISFPVSTSSSAIISLNSTLQLNLSTITETDSFFGGIAQSTMSGGTSTVISTGVSGGITPSLASNFSLSAPTSLSSINANSSAWQPSGTGVFTASGAVFISSSFGESGAILPPSANVSTSASALPTTSVNGSLPAGTGAFSTQGTITVTSISGSSGAAPPLSANISETASSSVPIPSTNSTTSEEQPEETEGPFSQFQIPEETPENSEVIETASSGVPVAPSANVSLPASASVTLTPSLNSSFFSGTGVFASSGAVTISSVLVESGAFPSTSSNSTVGIPPISSALNASFLGSTAIVSSTGTGGALTPSVNLTTNAPASLTPSPSTNLSTSLENESNSQRDRTGGLHLTSSQMTLIGTAPIPTGPPLPVVNSTLLPPGTAISSIPLNTTGPVGTGQPSITLPPLSANSSAAFPTGTDSTGPEFNNSGDDRIGRNRPRTSSSFNTPSAPTSNVTAPGTAPASNVPFVINSTAPSGTASGPTLLSSVVLSTQAGSTSAVPLISVNSTLPVGTASSILPLASANISISFSTAVPVSLGTPPISANSSAFSTSTTGMNSSLLVNVPIPLTTGATASISSVTVSSNYTLSASTGSASIPALSVNLTSPFSGGTASASSTLVLSENSLLPTGASISAFPIPSANITSYFATGTAQVNSTSLFVTEAGATGEGSTRIPSASSNATYAPSITPVPSLTAPLFSNSTSENCPSTPSFKIYTHEIIVTTTSLETVLVTPSTCASSTLLPLSFNSTLSPGTGTAFSVSIVTDTASSVLPIETSAVIPPSPSFTFTPSEQYRRRRPGQIATPEQIDQSCSNRTNIVANPNFALKAGDVVTDWTVAPDDQSISFRATSDNSSTYTGLILAAVPGRALTLTQPLTLCPGKQYKLTMTARQGNIFAKCTVEAFIGDRSVFTASPGERDTKKEGFYTAGKTDEACSQDLKLRTKCEGEGGQPVGTNYDGMMVLRVNDVSVEQIPGGGYV